MAGFDVSRIAQAFAQGQQIKQQRERLELEKQDRDLDLKERKEKLRLEELAAKRKEIMENMALNPHPQAPEIQTSAPQTTTMPFPGQAGEPQTSQFPDRSTALPLPPTTIPGVHGPDTQIPRTSMQQHLQQIEMQKQEAATAKANEPFTLNQGDMRFAGGQQIASNPKPEAQPPTPAKGPAIIEELKTFFPNFDSLDEAGKRQALTQYIAAKTPPSRAQSGGAADEPLTAIIGPDGKAVLVPRSQAAGKTPASSRDQGRQVTSGDSNKIADYSTSLDDVAVLSSVVTATGDTGTLAKIQAKAPNWVTEITGGWGAAAKSRQAVIDRVKQVIGKALEGGVLRKEDEYKYEKILPTIGDVKSVVTSKLQGLESAIKQRRQTLVDTLEDSGYDVSKHRARIDSPTPQAGGGGWKVIGVK
jgi:hypothetical protein